MAERVHTKRFRRTRALAHLLGKKRARRPADYEPRVMTRGQGVARIYKPISSASEGQRLRLRRPARLRIHAAQEPSGRADEYGQRFRYILVDEYQDTNKAQYEITQAARAPAPATSWSSATTTSPSTRGAAPTSATSSSSSATGPPPRQSSSRQNYRSTGNILERGKRRHRQQPAPARPRRLFTACARMARKIAVFLAADERDEGRWIAARSRRLHAEGSSYDDMAVFYRTNAQSRILEDMFLRAGVPYRIVGGTQVLRPRRDHQGRHRLPQARPSTRPTT